MTGLFPEEEGLASIPIPDAEVLFLRRLPLGEADGIVLEKLLGETAWRSETVRMWDKVYLQPRLMAWYGDPGASYEYSGKRYDPLPWTPLLGALRERVEATVGHRFNSVLLNWYRDGRDSVAMHADDERELGSEPVIASLSFGETRTFVMKHRTRRELGTRRFELPSGSLLVMRGATQRCWLHAVPKVTRTCGPRVNLTFRRVLGNPSTGSDLCAASPFLDHKK